MEQEKNYCVYKHVSPSGKCYIGITSINPLKRWKAGGWGYSRKTIFGKAIKKYGWDNFTHEIIFHNINRDLAEKIEIRYIYFYKYILCISYNDANGGRLAGKMSDEMKKKISDIHRGHKYNIGKICSIETRAKIGYANSLKIRTDEQKKHLSKINTGKYYASIPVIQFNIRGEFICEFRSAAEAAAKLKIQRPNISACCRGKHKSIGGYIWKYKNKIYET